MYGKIFDSIFKSTLVSEGGWLPTYIFMSMITIADKDGIADYADSALYNHLGFHKPFVIPKHDFDSAILYLENTKKITRLKYIDYIKDNRGWVINEYDKYIYIYSRCSTDEWKIIRNDVFIEDGYTCQYCGSVGGNLECDHIIPYSKGGRDTYDNLITSCKKCNQSKGNKYLGEWMNDVR